MVWTRCQHCDYEWTTSSELILVTCPSCGKKTKNVQKIEVEDEAGLNTNRQVPN